MEKKIFTTRMPAIEKIILERKEQARILMSDENAFWQVMEDGAWKRQRAWIIGGGPSLKGFDFKILEGEKVIATNTAFLEVPFADIEVFMDFNTFYRWLKEGRYGPGSMQAWEDFKGYKVHVDLVGRVIPGTYRIPTRVRSGLAKSLKTVYHGNNTGYSAIQIAVALKANPIYLLGYDFTYVGSSVDKSRRQHYHKGRYPEVMPEDVVLGYTNQLKRILPDIERRGIKIFNCSKISKADFFDYADPIQVLKGEENGQTGKSVGENH